MSEVVSHSVSYLQRNQRFFSVFGLTLGASYIGLVVALLLIGKIVHAGFLAGLPAVLIAIVIPRLALAQFIALLSIGLALVESIPVMLIDCSAAIVVLAAIFEALGQESLPRRLPPLTVLFLLLTGAVALSAIFGYSAVNGVTPVLKQLFLIAVFCSLFYLASRTGVKYLLTLFLVFIGIHSIYAAWPYVTSGGRARSFGLAHATFDDISMFALPIALAFFLWSRKSSRWLYLAAGLVSTLGLLATQSRAPIVFCAIGSIGVVAFTYWTSHKKTQLPENDSFIVVRQRIVWLVSILLVAILLISILSPSIYVTVFSRFGRLVDGRLGETIFLRATLWKAAIVAFLDHPILGVGAGSFRAIAEMYPGLSLDPVYFWVRGFSAHNLLFHYMAETGIVGASLLIALFWRLFSYSRSVWQNALRCNNAEGDDLIEGLALYAVGGMLLLTTFIDAGWMWGQTAYVFAFFAALIARRFADFGAKQPVS